MSLKSRREAMGKTQDEVAQEIGVKSEYYSQIERGRVKLPGPDLRRAISRALGMRHVDYLVEIGQLEEWELPGFSPSAPPPDPELDRRRALLEAIDLERDNRGRTLDVVLSQWAQQDRQRAQPLIVRNGTH